MAKCDPWSCVTQWWRSDDVDTRLRNQLEVHKARVRGVSAEIKQLGLNARAALQANRRDAALACLRAMRDKEAKRVKYEQMALFCQNTLDRVADMEAVHETMAALGDVRRQFGQTKMDEMYERFGATLQDVAEGNNAASDLQHLVAARAYAPTADLDEADLQRELDLLEREAAVEAPAGTAPPQPQPPPPQLRAPPQHTQMADLASVYAAAGVDVRAGVLAT